MARFRLMPRSDRGIKKAVIYREWRPGRPLDLDDGAVVEDAWHTRESDLPQSLPLCLEVVGDMFIVLTGCYRLPPERRPRFTARPRAPRTDPIILRDGGPSAIS